MSALSRKPWEAIGGVEAARVRDALLQLHHAVQLVAASGQTFAPPRDDDAHRAMTWSSDLEAFVGSGFAGPYPFRVALRPRDLTLLFLDRTDQALGALPLPGRPRSEGYEWLSLAVPTYLGGRPPRIERPEWEMSDHPVAHGRGFDVEPDALAVTAALYDGAAALLRSVRDAHPTASTVRCWPHHFDIATRIGVGDSGERSVGVGMAPSGGGHADWYWYVAPWPAPEPRALPDLAGGAGRWWTEGWTGAVLSRERVLAVEPSRRAGFVRGFVDEALVASRTALEAREE